jgi:diaminohydroxyphosphoribosylaminopyrimidine deaminase/5-amino-6-(5-phosphoribosylamino)uracil reductase
MADSSVGINPKVGSVVVCDNRIIGEGFHRSIGGPHAEVNAIEQVTDPGLLKRATLYVSLEPCSHHGRTPPCTDLILSVGIPRVVVGCTDPNPKVAGRGIEKLRAAGVEVELAPDPQPFRELNTFFFLNQSLHRPYILLKWAETSDGYIGRRTGERLMITGPQANRYVHGLRASYQSIFVGRTTARLDDPRLNVRLAPGKPPVRIVFDYDLALPHELQLFQTPGRLILINNRRDEIREDQLTLYKPRKAEAFMDLEILAKELYEHLQIGSILVEGGRYVLQQFINQHLYDEIQVIRSPVPAKDDDVASPVLPYHFHFDTVDRLGEDLLLGKKVWRPQG